jgi:hypothetical protein
MTWKRLKDFEDDNVYRGSVFRTPAKPPHEQFVDLMIVEDVHSDSGFSLVIVTGYDAGIVRLSLPEEAGTPEQRRIRSLSRRWIMNNWQKWIWPDNNADQVLFRRYYTVEDAS